MLPKAHTVRGKHMSRRHDLAAHDPPGPEPRQSRRQCAVVAPGMTSALPSCVRRVVTSMLVSSVVGAATASAAEATPPGPAVTASSLPGAPTPTAPSVPDAPPPAPPGAVAAKPTPRPYPGRLYLGAGGTLLPIFAVGASALGGVDLWGGLAIEVDAFYGGGTFTGDTSYTVFGQGLSIRETVDGFPINVRLGLRRRAFSEAIYGAGKCDGCAPAGATNEHWELSVEGALGSRIDVGTSFVGVDWIAVGKGLSAKGPTFGSPDYMLGRVTVGVTW